MRGLVLRVCCAILLSVTLAFGAKPSKVDENSAQLSKLNQFFGILFNYYIEDLDSEPLVESAIRATLNELDPHSTYFNAEEMRAISENLEGKFSGVGIEFDIVNDTLRVINTTTNGPAERVGVMANDRIVKVDSLYIIGVNRSEVSKILRGKSGSRVEIEVIRGNKDTPLHFSIVRADIPINTIDASYLLNDKSGYIKVNRFGESTMREFREAYHNLGRLENLVVDLRGNRGGLLHQAVEMAGFFLPKGSIIVTTEGRGVPSARYDSKSKGEFRRGNVVIIIDEHSASASEIVAGAIQDWDRGVIVGQTSFGKGLVQRQYPLPDGSNVRVTVAQYHTPSGRVIQRPYTKGDKEEYYARSREDIDTLTAPQYKTLRRGRKVYGAGGIIPDIKILKDTTHFSDGYLQLLRNGAINKFTINYLDTERSKLLEKYNTPEQFISQFELSLEMITELVALSDMECEDVDLQALMSECKLYIKALIARRLYSLSTFFEIMNSKDTITFAPIDRLLNNWSIEKKKVFGN